MKYIRTVFVIIVSCMMLVSTTGVASASTRILGEENHMGFMERLRQWQLDKAYGSNTVSYEVFRRASEGGYIDLIIELEDEEYIDDLVDDFNVDEYERIGNTSEYVTYDVDIYTDDVVEGIWSSFINRLGFSDDRDLVVEQDYVDTVYYNRDMSVIDSNHEDTLDYGDLGVTTQEIREYYGIEDYNWTGDGIDVAVLDTGIRTDSIDGQNIFDENRTNIYSTIDSTGIDEQGHGTHVASITGGSEVNTEFNNENITTQGIANETNIHSIQVLGSDGGGSESDIMEGVELAIEEDVDIISMSLGGAIPPFTALYDTINRARAEGIVVIGASGNSRLGVPLAPASWNSVFSVGSCTIDGYISSFTNLRYDIMATGHDVTAPSVDGGSVDMMTMSGTSMATPVVSGITALLMEYDPTLRGSPEDVYDYLLEYADYDNPRGEVEPFTNFWSIGWDNYNYDIPRVNFSYIMERYEDDYSTDNEMSHGDVDYWRTLGYNP